MLGSMDLSLSLSLFGRRKRGEGFQRDSFFSFSFFLVEDAGGRGDVVALYA